MHFWFNGFSCICPINGTPHLKQRSKQVSELFDAESTGKKSEIEFEEPEKISKYKGYETKIYKTLKHYMKVSENLFRLDLPILFYQLFLFVWAKKSSSSKCTLGII